MRRRRAFAGGISASAFRNTAGKAPDSVDTRAEQENRMRYWGKNIAITGDWMMASSARDDDNLSPNPDARGFEERMQSVFRLVQSNPVGEIVLNALNAAPHSVSVRPVAEGAVNKLSARPISDDNALETDKGSPSAAGRGSDVVIWFKSTAVTIGGHVYRADDGLLHECVHALRQARGRWRATALAGWDNQEEMYASMIANIYASSDNRNGDMRSTHAKAFSAMNQSEFDFQAQFHSQILDFRTAMYDVYDRLASVKASWNPLTRFENMFWGAR
jgi:hypothetical protein